MISLSGVTVRRGGRAILDGVDIAFEPGRVTAVVGPNGAGKSTLLGVAAGDLVPDAGTVLMDGAPMAAMSAAELAARRAVLPQSIRIGFPFTVRELVALGDPAAARTGRPEEALARVGLAGYGGRNVTTLSGGEQQRAHLARTLLQVWHPVTDGRPRALFLDEPTASLDLRHQIEALDIARAFSRAGGAVIAVLHDLNLASAHADRVVALADGRIAADGPPAATIDAATVARVFGVNATVARAEDGRAYVLPWAAAG